MEPTNEEVAIRVQNGDKNIFGLLVDRFELKFLRYGRKFLARSEDIEDIVQDIFIQTYQNIKSFDGSQKFSPWIYRIAHNAFVNALKKKSKIPLVLFNFDTLISHEVYEDPAEALRDQEEMKKMINLGIEKLPSKYREILILYYLEELTYKEIAEILEIPNGTVGVRLKRAKNALQKIYTTMHRNIE